MSEEKIIGLLKGSKVFRGLSEREWISIAGKGRIRHFAFGETIIREGQIDHSLFIVIRGRVEAVLNKRGDCAIGQRPTRVRLGDLQRGDCVGEYSLIDNLPASADVVAVEPCEMFEIPRRGFEEIVNSSDRIAGFIYRNMLLMMISRARQRNKELDLCY